MSVRKHLVVKLVVSLALLNLESLNFLIIKTHNFLSKLF
jgi:hypothetical protein